MAGVLSARHNLKSCAFRKRLFLRIGALENRPGQACRQGTRLLYSPADAPLKGRHKAGHPIEIPRRGRRPAAAGPDGLLSGCGKPQPDMQSPLWGKDCLWVLAGSRSDKASYINVGFLTSHNPVTVERIVQLRDRKAEQFVRFGRRLSGQIVAEKVQDGLFQHPVSL